MNRLIYPVSIIGLLCLLADTLHSQSIASELGRIRNAYMSAEQLSFDVEVYSYSTKSDVTGELITKGFMRKSNDLYYSRINNYELVILGDKALIVDKEKKTLDYYEYKVEKPFKDVSYDLKIDSILIQSDSILLRHSDKGLKHFTCFSRNGVVRQTEIYADIQSNLIKRILYYYVDSNEDYEIEVDRVEIFYNGIRTSNIDQQYFSFDRYFRKAGSSLIPVGDFTKYEINYHSS